MTDHPSTTATLQILAKEVQALAAAVSPFLTRAEMAQRKRCHTDTIIERVKRRQYPAPNQHGLWFRAEVMEWEAAELAGKSKLH